MSWTRTKVGNLLAIRPQSINPAKSPNERFTLYSIPAFDRGTPDIVAGSEIGSSKQILSPGDVLLSKIVPHIRRCWVVGHDSPGQTQIGSGEWMVFRSAHVDPNYLSKVLVGDEFHQAFMRTVAGVGGSLLRARPAAVAEIEIPVPETLDEQKRIAAVLDKADALRRQRKESLQLTEQLLQSVFIDMFVRNPEAANWTPQSVKWMAKDAKGSMRTGPFGSQLLHSEFVDSGIAVLGIDNAVKNRFEWGQPRFVTSEKYQGLKRYKVFPGDLIITIMGTLGRCAIVPDDIPESINTKHLCCITLDHKKCLPEFLHAAFLNHPEVLRQLGVRTKGAVMPGLNMGIIKDLELPMPPIELQEEFKRVVALCAVSRADLEDSQDAAEALFCSVQQRAFRGELDLNRLVLDSEPELPAVAITLGHSYNEGVYNRPGYFIAPPEIEAQMMALEDRLDTGPGDSIPWSEDYFKYRTLSQLLRPPFSFTEIWDRVYYDMEEASYETVKEKVFDYVAAGILEQQFDEKRKEIVFHPRP